MRNAIILATLLLAGAIGWFVLRERESKVDSFAPPVSIPSPPSEPADPPDPSAEEHVARVPEIVHPAATKEPAEDPRLGPSGDEVELRGTIVAIDENGAEHRREEGQFELIVVRGRSGHGQTVSVQEGRWNALVPRDIQLDYSEVLLGGRSAVPEHDVAAQQPFIALPEDGVIEFRVRWLRPIQLFVRDRDTNADLDNVTLIRAEDWPRNEFSHPGEIKGERYFVESAPSPISIAPPSERYLAIHVGSPGRAWEHVQLDAAEGGERIVLLGTGGDLDVQVDARRMDSGAVVRVRHPHRNVLAEVDVRESRTFAFEGLPTGKLSVSAEIGDWWESPIVLAKVEVDILAGQRQHAVLSPVTAPTLPSVVLAGEVVMPPAWGVQSFVLLVELLDPPLGGREANRSLGAEEMRPDAERPNVWHWRLEGLQAGRYQIRVFQLQHSISLRVPDTGREDIVFEVPPPCEALVHVVDKETGTEAQVEGLLWNGQRPKWVTGGVCDRAEWDGEARGWRMRAPRGKVEVFTEGDAYQQARKLVELRDGTNEITLEAQRQHRIYLKLEHNGKAIPWPQDIWVKRQPREGGPEQNIWPGSRGATLFIEFDRPGSWIITVPDIPGYEPIPPFEVSVDPQLRSEHVIALVPKE